MLSSDMFSTVHWVIKRENILPILELKAESTKKNMEIFVLHSAIQIIEKANEFKGELYPSMPKFPYTEDFTISFSLIFPSDSNILEFVNSLKQ